MIESKARTDRCVKYDDPSFGTAGIPSPSVVSMDFATEVGDGNNESQSVRNGKRERFR